MKKTHIIAIIIIACAIGAIMGTVADSSTYASFSIAAENPDDEFHVVGMLCREKEIIYDPVKDANLFTFYMKDNEGNERRVIFNGSKPQDFERSEQIVITGQAIGNEFKAEKILMKCPSKYTDSQSPEMVEVSANPS